MSQLKMLMLFTDGELEMEVLELLNDFENEPDQFVVHKATSPGNALELIATDHFALTLLGLPVTSTIGDGLNLILQMRQLKPIMPIIVLVNQDALGVGIQAMEFGASAFFSRFYLSAKMLQQIIKNLANQFHQLQDYEVHGAEMVNALPVGVLVLDNDG